MAGTSTLNKKVLLRERKRHTARRVVSTPSVVLPGYPPRQGTTPPWPDLAGGGVPDQGIPQPGYPPSQGNPLARVPPPPSWTWQGTPQLPHGILGNVAKHYGIWVPPPRLPHGIPGNVAKHYGIWVPPPVDKLAK